MLTLSCDTYSTACLLLLVNAFLAPLSVPAQPQPCQEVSWSDQEGIGRALDLNYPTIAVNMSRNWPLTKQVAGMKGMKKLWPNNEILEVSLTSDGSFYGARSAEDSPIGKARHRP